ncbi:hypothetical protein DMH03_13470 [Amycolatopsis sp. WAC 01376]|uniref:hypothetical protein n=1 Tax=Amycolatopsis sp. WAC 01376 TaxID=2203195 RepID=UPI000F7B6ADB|nr:hypothetical protein [Amycolatopsis sp. WAC 01376]RSM63042.1 hypothetical protein DMH03_13470 [Amycolatopsis sp. WAC 01376]
MTLRLLRAETMRLRTDLVLLGYLAMTALLSAPSSGIGQSAFVATLYGAHRYALDRRHGVVARTVLSGQRTPTLAAKTVVTALCGGLLGLVGAAGAAVAGATAWDFAIVLGAMPAAAACAVVGLCFGVVIGNYFLAPVAAFGAFAGSAVVLQLWPGIGRALPLGAALSLLTDAEMNLLSRPLAVIVLLAWLLVTGAVAWWSMNARDVA